MSRSFKKNPITKDFSKSSKKNKQLANRVIRRKLKNYDFELANGKSYKKLFESWDIHDYISRWTLEQALNEYRNPTEGSWFASETFKNKYPTEEKFINFWKKEMIRK